MRSMLRVGTLVAVLATSMVDVGCGHGGTGAKSRDVNLTSAQLHGGASGPITQAELQDELQRFTGVFIDRMTQAMGEIARSGTPEVTEAALRGALRYASYSLDIATGPLPEVNVLDMAVFLRLCHAAFESHWMPAVYGEKGRPVLEVFRTAEQELSHITARVMTPEQRAKLDRFIDQWRKENPDQFQVEGVRMMDFAQRAGQVETKRAEDTGGLLASVQSATQAADQALLVAERGMFLAHRMPFLMRLQARLGSREIIGDALAKIGSPAQLMSQVEGFEPMVKQLPALVQHSEQTVHEARLLAKDVQPLIPSQDSAEKIDATITKVNALTLNTRNLLQDLRGLTPEDPKGTAAAAKRGVDDTLRKTFLYLALLGATMSLVWWGGYYLVKRRLAHHVPGAIG